MPFPADGSLALIELLEKKLTIVDGPAMNSRVVNGDAPLLHHLFIAILCNQDDADGFVVTPDRGQVKVG